LKERKVRGAIAGVREMKRRGGVLQSEKVSPSPVVGLVNRAHDKKKEEQRV